MRQTIHGAVKNYDTIPLVNLQANFLIFFLFSSTSFYLIEIVFLKIKGPCELKPVFHVGTNMKEARC